MRLRLLMLGACLALSVFAHAQALPPDFALQLTLHDAVFHGGKPAEWNPALIMSVRREGGQWMRVLAKAEDFNVATHTGLVLDSAITPDAVKLQLEMSIIGDPWVPGGKARYEVTLARTDDGSLRGTHRGTFRGQTITGKADGYILARRSLGGPSFVPVQPGEHPRLLFRKSDLPALRKKAQTPFGKAYLDAITNGYEPRIVDMQGSQKVPDTISLGIKYQLTGDRKYAESAMRGVEEHMNNRLGGSGSGKRAWGPRLEFVAVTYDLCCDAWPEGFRRRVEGYMRLYCHYTFFDQFKVASGEMGWGLWGHAAQIYAGASIMSLALWGEPGPEPGKPISPSEADRIAPAQDYVPGDGVPVVPFETGKMPSRWLYTPAVDFVSSGDPCIDLGGCEQARPQAGTSMEVDDATVTFKPLPADAWVPENGEPVVSPRSRAKGTGCVNLQKIAPFDASTTVLYTVLKNDRKREIKVTNPATTSGRALLVLNGNVLHDGRVVEIDEGLYPLLVILRLGTKWDWLKATFAEATLEDIEASRDDLARRQGEYRDAYRDWQIDDEAWKRTGGMDQRHLQYVRMGEFAMGMFMRGGFGSGGFQRDFYFADTLELAQRYASYHRNMFGDDVTPYDDVSLFLPRRVVTTLFTTEGKALAQSVSGPGLPGIEDFAYCFPLVKAEWQPAMLWAWNYMAGVKGPNDIGRVLAITRPEQAFINYPMEMQPVGPGWVLPSFWEAPDFGWYFARSGWRNDKDFTTQVFLNANATGTANAGTFRIYGLGHIWADMGWGHLTVGVSGKPGSVKLPNSMSPDYLGMRSSRYRFEENVVLFPKDTDLNDDAAARLVQKQAYPDGALSLTMDMADVYATAARDARGNRLPVVDRFGLRRDATFRDSGISGWRAIAVDYSGKSGAPCLFVVVDQIKGAKDTVWAWQFHSQLPQVTVDGNRFRYDQGDANMVGTFVAPTPVKLAAEGRLPEKLGAEVSRPYNPTPKPITLNRSDDNSFGLEGGRLSFPVYYHDAPADVVFTSPLYDLPYPVEAVFAEGGDTYICVVTIQPGEAPAVQVEGEGLAAKVTVGKRLITFDGNRIVLGDVD